MTDKTPANAIMDFLRTALTFILVRPAYWLLGLSYELFFNVANADLFNNATILGFYKRFQLIIGVFMIFQLAMTIMKGIVSPDTFTDKKGGINSIITRVITALILLVVLTPISIPGARTEYERQLNNNGLLFGTLYSLQHRILSNNTLGRLVLGTTDQVTTSSDNDTSTGVSGQNTSATKTKQAANVFTATVLKTFMSINLVPEENRKPVDAGKDPAILNENRMCKDIDDATLHAYTSLEADPGELLDLVNAYCTPDNGESWLSSPIEKSKSTFMPKLSGKSRYMFYYNPLLAAIVGFVFVFILLSFTIEVAVRAVKLAVLRIIAPIPIISYMDPKGGKDGSFNAWVKALTSTYLDLFIRLAIIFFVIYLIQDMIANGVVMDTGSGMVGMLSHIIIWIGLFVFAKQAPKFIKQVLGLKDDAGGKLFGGFGELAGVAGMGAAALGSIGAGVAGYTASKKADATNGVSSNFFNRGKHLVAGMIGGATGLGAGMSAAVKAKDHAVRAALDAQQKRVAMDISRGSSGSTFMGRNKANWEKLISGQDYYDKKTTELNKWKAQEKTGKDLFSYLEGKGKTDGAGYRVSTRVKFKDENGNETTYNFRNASLSEFNRAYQDQKTNYDHGRTRDTTFTVGGQQFDIYDDHLDKVREEITYAAASVWAQNNADDPPFSNKLKDYEYAGGTFDSSAADPSDPSLMIGVSNLKKANKKAGGEATHIENSSEYHQAKANHGATGGSK